MNAQTASFLATAPGLLPDRRRVPVLAVVVALHVLLILLLLLLAPPRPKGKPGITSMVAVNIATPTPERAKPTPRPQPQKQQKAQPTPKRAAPQPEPIVVAPNAAPAKWSFGDPALRGFDLAMIPTQEAPAQVADAGGPPDSAVVGVAPDGSKLYAAEWQREPTDQELSFYLRKARGAAQAGAYGLIACRTAARFKVEDCRPIGESPGSGLGFAVNEAAWQFRVKPPRVNGDYQVGTWVSIRIDIRPQS